MSRTHRRYRAWRRAVLAADPLCSSCLKDGIYQLAQELHHRVALNLGGALMERSNVVPLCTKCHHDQHQPKRLRDDLGRYAKMGA